MSIEQDLRTIPVAKTPKHKSFLKAALTTHTPMKRKRKSRFVPLFALAPAFALLLFVTVAIIQPGSDNGPGTQKTFGPLTAQRVFALAQENVSDQLLQPGQYYYQKVRETLTLFMDSGSCQEETNIAEHYTNANGIMELSVIRTVDGKLFSVTSQTEKGDAAGPDFYSDFTTELNSRKKIECPIIAPSGELSQEDKPDETQMYIDPTVETPETKATIDLMSNVPSRQRQAYEVLQDLKGWSVVEHQTVNGYDKPVILLVNHGSSKYQYIAYFFDQITKNFVGFENVTSRTIVLERDVRPLQRVPEAMDKITPAGL